MNENEKRIYLLEKENVKKALLILGIPTMIGMLVSALYNIVDAFFIGRLGTLQTAAVSVVYPLTMVASGIGLLFGCGAGSYISRLLGRKKYEEIADCSSTALFSGIFISIAVVGGMMLFFEPLIYTLGATKSSITYAKEYGMIYLFGLIFNVFNMMMNNMLVAEGNSGFGMTAMLVGGCINLVLDPVLIFSCNMGVVGAAVATLFSQIVSSALYVCFLVRGKSYLKISLGRFKPNKVVYTEVLKIGFPVCMFQFLTGGAVGLTNIAAKPFGEAAIAGMGIVNRIMSLESNALYGFLKGYSPIVGYNHGSGNSSRVREATKTAICWSTAVNILFGILCIIFSRQLIYLFNQESANVLEVGKQALTVDGISFMTLGVQIVIGNYFLATGKAKQGGALSICRQGLFFILFLFLFTNIWGLTGLILAQLAADLCATFVTVVLWRKEKGIR